MSDQPELGDLVAYLVRTSRLDPAQATRLVDEVMSFLDETPEAFIRRRHRELQARGMSNAEIFEGLSAELEQHRFRAPAYSARQIRRIIYG